MKDPRFMTVFVWDSASAIPERHVVRVQNTHAAQRRPRQVPHVKTVIKSLRNKKTIKIGMKCT